MGVHVTAYAVDAVEFATLIERPLWRVLMHLREAEPGAGRDVLFGPYDTAARQHCAIRPDRQVVRAAIGGGVVLAPEELEAVPFLRQSTREYLAGGSSFDLDFLLRGFAAVPAVG